MLGLTTRVLRKSIFPLGGQSGLVTSIVGRSIPLSRVNSSESLGKATTSFVPVEKEKLKLGKALIMILNFAAARLVVGAKSLVPCGS